MKRFTRLFRAWGAALLILLALETPVMAIVVQDWLSPLPGPDHDCDEMHGLAVDANGNAYIIGDYFSHTSHDYILVKYAPSGAIAGYSLFNGQGQSSDYPDAIITDAGGNVYVAARCFLTSQSDYVAIVKYNAAGQQVWYTGYNCPLNALVPPFSLALDPQGNLLLAGTTTSSYSDFLTLKYSSAGALLWVAAYNGPANGSDQATDLALDGQGNVYVAGGSAYPSGTGSNQDCAVIKYSANGLQQWIAWHHDPSEEFSYPSIDLDSQGNIYVTGSSQTGGNQIDYLTLKFDASGREVWSRRYDGPMQQPDCPCGLAVDPWDNVIVSGTSSTPAAWGQEYLTIKYDPAGNQLWMRGYRGNWVESNTMNCDLALDAEGSVYLTGTSAYYSFYPDCGTIKYDSQGNLKWIAISKYRDDCFGGGYYLALDAENNVFVAGDYATIGMDPSFLTVKLRQIPGEVSVAMTPSAVPVVIPAQGGSFSYELATVNGVADSLAIDYWWRAIYPSSTLSQFLCGPLSVEAPPDSSLLQRVQRVPGNAAAGTYLYILNAGRYPGIIWATDTLQVTKAAAGNGPLIGDWANTGEQAQPVSIPSGLQMTSSPNPFNTSTVASYKLQVASYVSLKVYDTAGRLVATLAEGWRDAGEHHTTFDGAKLASGVYLARLETTSGLGAIPTTETQKLVLLK
jgi:hypothetical protein